MITEKHYFTWKYDLLQQNVYLATLKVNDMIIYQLKLILRIHKVWNLTDIFCSVVYMNIIREKEYFYMSAQVTYAGFRHLKIHSQAIP